MPCYISKLPNHILKAIFCLLPVTTLIECRYVCKSWLRILSHPDFSNLHLPKRKPTGLFLCKKGVDGNLYWLEVEGAQSLHFNLAANIKYFSSESAPIEIINSCNGLVCVCQGYDSMSIINPITSECVNLPLHDRGRMLYARLCGIGLDCQTNKFKVIRFSCPLTERYIGDDPIQDFPLKAEICTLGNHHHMSWRSIAGLPSQHGNYFWDSFHPFVNGSLHFCLCEEIVGNRGAYVCAFDFHTETFTSLSLPSFQFSVYDVAKNIGVFRDCLTFCHSTCEMMTVTSFDGDWEKGNTVIWMMKEYGFVASWTKMFVLKDTLDTSRMQLLENGCIICFLFSGNVHLYNPATKRYTDLKIESRLLPILHNPSFTSLKDVVGVSSRLSTRQRDIKKKIIKTMISHFLFRDLPRFIKFIMAMLVVIIGTIIFDSRSTFCGDGVVCRIAFEVAFFAIVRIVNWMVLAA